MTESVLVTGGSGFIGRHVLEELRDAGYGVAALTHASPLPDRPGFEAVDAVDGDVTRFESLPSFEPYDAVVHLAGVVSVGDSLERPRRTYEVNTTGTVNVFERARADDVGSVVYGSSAAIYGIPDELPITESQSVEPLHPYAASKLAGEQVAKATANAYELDVAVVRPFTTYGPGQRSDNLIPHVVSQLQSGADVLELGNLSPTRDFVYVRDVASAIRTVVDSDRQAADEGTTDDSPTAADSTADVYNVGSESETSVREVVERLRSLMESDASIESTKKRDERVEIPRMVADCSRLKRLGWRPEFDLESGLEQTIAQEDSQKHE
ncbi:NAD-dependent epimerase/dehydratase family protein [Haloprofundus salilacus]|uniref:NAD-dependent epimerase/dehydratase family protein n=1 Tax=Haloprofundus salilacus TaxID=2876190 RepID=UPI001CCF2AB9|nr:NAD-dependent epimerase/dehydratase family protein [Haloprofundus salilacus]